METRPIGALKSWKKNPRSITRADFDRLKRQIMKLGQYKPLIVTPDGTVLGGNMRLRAYKELGITDVWVSIVTPKNEQGMVEYALSDNDRAGSWDEEQLTELVRSVPDLAIDDFKVDLGRATDLSTLVDQFGPIREENDFTMAVPKEPKTKLGDFYVLGAHRLLCGDSTKRGDVERLMDGEQADMVFADPPYGMNLDTDFSSMRGKMGSGSGKIYDRVIGDDAPFDFNSFRWLDTKEQFWWGADYYRKTLPDNGGWFVWDKAVDDGGDKMFGSAFELCWSKQLHKREIVRLNWCCGRVYEEYEERKRMHPTQKPIALARYFITRFLNKNTILLDPFGGSGTTMIACEQTGTRARLCEVSPHYCDVIVSRYCAFTGAETVILNGEEIPWITVL